MRIMAATSDSEDSIVEDQKVTVNTSLTNVSDNVIVFVRCVHLEHIW